VKEAIIPQSTPLCRYAQGYFGDKKSGDKCVEFLFVEHSGDSTALFYNKQLIYWEFYMEDLP